MITDRYRYQLEAAAGYWVRFFMSPAPVLDSSWPKPPAWVVGKQRLRCHARGAEVLRRISQYLGMGFR